MKKLWILIVALTALTGGCTSPPPAPAGKIIFESYRDGNAEVYTMDEDGSNLVNLTNHPAYDGAPAWSPDGQQIAFTSERDGAANIYVMDADGTNVARLTDEGGNSAVPAWSPDGSRIAFLSDRTYKMPGEGGYTEVEANSKIWVMNADGSGATRVTRMLGLDMFPSWAPDSRQLVYMSVRDSSPEIYLLRADNIEVNLTQHPAADMNPEWSPDGSKIAFMSDRAGNMDVFVMDTQGGSIVNLTNQPGNDGDPTWSPDGSKIAFISDRDGNTEIYVMNADGSDQRRLTNDSARDQHPAWWQPD
ncbi:MAG: DPP IV N-terminal domain-containing protein [Anaerolineae bacterium]